MDVLRSELLSQHGLAHGFSTRLGGVSAPPYDALNLGESVGDAPDAVAENRNRFAHSIGYTTDHLCEVQQVHGTTILTVTARDEPAAVRSQQADALITTDSDRALGIRTADCVPLLLAHPASGTVGAVHAGWRGAVAGIVHDAVIAMAVAPSELIAAIGPHIRLDAFEIGEEVAQSLVAAAGGHSVVDRSRDKPHGDLTALVTHQLMTAGLPASHIEDVGGCTHSERARFFSHRRDRGTTGRHLSVIVCPC